MAPAPIRVLLAIDSFGIGGKERQAVELARGLARTVGVDLHVACFGPEDFYASDVQDAGVPVDFAIRRGRWDVRVFQTIRLLIARYQPDVIHTNGLVSSFYCLPLAKARGIPLINGSIRNAFSPDGVRWWIERLLLHLSDVRLSNSRAGLRSRSFSEDDPRNRVIYNGFDFSRLRPVRCPGARSDVDGGTPVFTAGMVAEFSCYKDYRTFIEAAAVVQRSSANVRFAMVGDGATRRECEALANGLEGVCFLGQRKDVLDVIDGFDVGVLCTFTEGVSNSIMEYMALGKPVVATAGGGTDELVVNGETGFLVEAANAAKVAAAISYLVEHPDVGRKMGAAGRVRLQERFSLTAMIERTLDVYQRAVPRT